MLTLRKERHRDRESQDNKTSGRKTRQEHEGNEFTLRGRERIQIPWESLSMDGQHERRVIEQIVRWSWTRISISQNSFRTINEMLERSRRSVEESMRRLEESQRLVEDPFYCPWQRGADGRSPNQGIADLET